jgi:hypothetical protein
MLATLAARAFFVCAISLHFAPKQPYFEKICIYDKACELKMKIRNAHFFDPSFTQTIEKVLLLWLPELLLLAHFSSKVLFLTKLSKFQFIMKH